MSVFDGVPNLSVKTPMPDNLEIDERIDNKNIKSFNDAEILKGLNVQSRPYRLTTKPYTTMSRHLSKQKHAAPQTDAIFSIAPTGIVDTKGNAINQPFFVKPSHVRTKIVRVKKKSDNPEDYYFTMNTPGYPMYVYALIETMSLKKLIEIQFNKWRENDIDFPDINEGNYINTNLPNPNISAENNICFFIMIIMPFEGVRVLVSNLVGFTNNERFQQNIDNLLDVFSKKTGFPRERIQCCAINLNTYNYNDPASYERKQQVDTYAVYFYSTRYGHAIPTKDGGWQSTVQTLDFLNTEVNIMFEFSENSKSENKITHGPLKELFAEILGFTIKERNEETEGGTRKKKRKTKRKKQRSKRRKHRSQKKH